MWQTGTCEIKSELSLSGIKTAWKRPVQARTDSSPPLKITTCEKSVCFIRLHFPRARQHPGSTPPTGPSLHFSRDLHLIPPCRTRLDSTWVPLGLWPKSRASRATPPPALGRRPGVGFTLCATSPSCLNLTDFLILKAASDPDSTTSFMFVPGFFLFLRTPKQEQSFRDRRLNMAVRLLQDQSGQPWASLWDQLKRLPLQSPLLHLQQTSVVIRSVTWGAKRSPQRLRDVAKTKEEAFPRFRLGKWPGLEPRTPKTCGVC